jgi:hypothetical protein
VTATVLTAGEARAEELAAQFAALPEVAAIALGGSVSSGAADHGSDVDVYVYTIADLSPTARTILAEQARGAARADLGLPYWGGVNVWVDAATGMTLDLGVFAAAWMESEIARVMDAHQPALGYSTCFCRTVAQSRVLHDPSEWLAALQARSRRDYPEPLRRNIIAHNHPVLRRIITSYFHQIEAAVQRQDVVSIHHRLAALVASYFDVLFALNRVLHPGEKRLLAFAQRECALLPIEMSDDLISVLAATGTAHGELLPRLGRLLDRLDDLLRTAGFVGL